MDRGLGGNDAAGLGAAIVLPDLRVLLNTVYALNNDAICIGNDLNYLALDAPVFTRDDLD